MMPNKRHKICASSGFTLIELLVVVSIIVILSGFLVPSFNTYSENQNVLQAAEQLQSDLRSVQNNALSGVGADGTFTHWVVYIPDNGTRYSYFRADGTNYTDDCTSSAQPATFTSNLPRNTMVRNGPICIFFSYENGDVTYNTPDNGADGSACSTSDPTNCIVTVGHSADTSCRAIELNTPGLIKEYDNQLNCEY